MLLWFIECVFDLNIKIGGHIGELPPPKDKKKIGPELFCNHSTSLYDILLCPMRKKKLLLQLPKRAP